MRLSPLIAGCVAAALFATTNAVAANYVVELSQPKAKKLETIGTVPPRRFIELELGDLRTREARLPGGVLTVKDRTRMRARQALERQREVTKARRTNVDSADAVTPE